MTVTKGNIINEQKSRIEQLQTVDKKLEKVNKITRKNNIISGIEIEKKTKNNGHLHIINKSLNIEVKIRRLIKSNKKSVKSR